MFRPGLEADDCLGILATGEVAGFMGDKVVCSIDKDMLSFPCNLYNWNHPELGVQVIYESDANRAFYSQILTGDAVDGYPGCPGVGPVRAKKLLADADIDSAWGIIVKAYEKKGLTEKDALIQARVARILRSEDYNFVNKTPILWVPKGEDNGQG
jgi:DNA polymerase-1